MAVDRASDNPFPSVLFAEHVDPSNPAAGYKRLFVDTDHIMKTIDSSGTIVQLGQGMTDPMTTRGDIIYRDSSNTTARLGRGSATQVLTSDGTDIAWATPSSGFSDPMTTRGDIIVRNSSNATARLAAGTANRVFKSDGTDVAWGLPHSFGCIISGTSTALSNGAFVSLAFGTADTYDPDGYHDPSSNNTKITIPSGLGGQYRLRITTTWPSSGSANTDRRIGYKINAGSDVILNRHTYSVSSLVVYDTQEVDIVVAAGDTIECRQWTGIGSTTTTLYDASLFLWGV